MRIFEHIVMPQGWAGRIIEWEITAGPEDVLVWELQDTSGGGLGQVMGASGSCMIPALPSHPSPLDLVIAMVIVADGGDVPWHLIVRPGSPVPPASGPGLCTM